MLYENRTSYSKVIKVKPVYATVRENLDNREEQKDSTPLCRLNYRWLQRMNGCFL